MFIRKSRKRNHNVIETYQMDGLTTGAQTGTEPGASPASALVIFNPAAGRRRARRIAAALRGLRAAGGGRLAVIPLGTANVLAAELGIADAAGAIAALKGGRDFSYRPGLANGRGFLMMAGVGFDAHVVAGIAPRTKRLLGKGAYVLGMLRQLRRFSFPSYRVTVDGITREAASVVVARGHFYAGRFVLAPAARLDQAALHVCLFHRAGRLAVLRYAIALGLGRISRGSGFEILVGRQILIEGPVGDPVQGDGDKIGRASCR